jgi:hypothetical protein
MPVWMAHTMAFVACTVRLCRSWRQSAMAARAFWHQACPASMIRHGEYAPYVALWEQACAEGLPRLRWAPPKVDFCTKTWPSWRRRLLMRTDSRSRGRSLSCEWVVAAEVGDGGVVVRTAKYSETDCPCRTGRQVLRGGGILAYGPPSAQTIGRTPLFDGCRMVGPSPGPLQHLCVACSNSLALFLTICKKVLRF